jgi:hypothetical protein
VAEKEEKLEKPDQPLDTGGRDRPSDLKERVQLQLSAEAAERLRLLRELTQASSNAEVFRKGLHVYEWLLQQLAQGYRIRLVKGNEEKDVEFVI